MRNLEHDKNFIEQILAATPADIPPMFAEIAALHAIERAIAAESKLLLAVKGLKEITETCPTGAYEIKFIADTTLSEIGRLQNGTT